MGYSVIKLMNSRRRKMKLIREENNNNGKKADKMHVKEWLHENAKRPVKVKFGPDEAFYLLNRKGDKLRTISIKNIESMVLEVTQVNGFFTFLILYFYLGWLEYYEDFLKKSMIILSKAFKGEHQLAAQHCTRCKI